MLEDWVCFLVRMERHLCGQYWGKMSADACGYFFSRPSKYAFVSVPSSAGIHSNNVHYERRDESKQSNRRFHGIAFGPLCINWQARKKSHVTSTCPFLSHTREPRWSEVYFT